MACVRSQEAYLLGAMGPGVVEALAAVQQKCCLRPCAPTPLITTLVSPRGSSVFLSLAGSLSLCKMGLPHHAREPCPCCHARCLCGKQPSTAQAQGVLCASFYRPSFYLRACLFAGGRGRSRRSYH